MANEEDRQRLPGFFYRTEAGHEPVREWLKELDPDERKAIGTDLLRAGAMANRHAGVQSLGKGLWEVRTGLASNRTARVLFFVHEGRVGVVHGFIKKTQKTPVADPARKRMKEMQA